MRGLFPVDPARAAVARPRLRQHRGLPPPNRFSRLLLAAFAAIGLLTAAAAPAGPEGVLGQARALAQQGQPQQAFQTLDSWLAKPPRRPIDADAAALHLEAARLAVAA